MPTSPIQIPRRRRHRAELNRALLAALAIEQRATPARRSAVLADRVGALGADAAARAAIGAALAWISEDEAWHALSARALIARLAPVAHAALARAHLALADAGAWAAVTTAAAARRPGGLRGATASVVRRLAGLVDVATSSARGPYRWPSLRAYCLANHAAERDAAAAWTALAAALDDARRGDDACDCRLMARDEARHAAIYAALAAVLDDCDAALSGAARCVEAALVDLGVAATAGRGTGATIAAVDVDDPAALDDAIRAALVPRGCDAAPGDAAAAVVADRPLEPRLLAALTRSLRTVGASSELRVIARGGPLAAGPTPDYVADDLTSGDAIAAGVAVDRRWATARWRVIVADACADPIDCVVLSLGALAAVGLRHGRPVATLPRAERAVALAEILRRAPPGLAVVRAPTSVAARVFLSHDALALDAAVARALDAATALDGPVLRAARHWHGEPLVAARPLGGLNAPDATRRFAHELDAVATFRGLWRVARSAVRAAR